MSPPRPRLTCFLTAALALSVSAAAQTRTLQNGRSITPYPNTWPDERYAYYGCLDTQIDPAAPTANFGGERQLGWQGGTNRKVLILFRDLHRAIGPGQVIQSATLRLRVVPGQWTTGNEIRVYRLLRPWRAGSHRAGAGPQHWTASWQHALYSANAAEAQAWSTPGAAGAGVDRAAAPTVTVNTGANYSGGVWQIPGLATDVARFYAAGHENFGWVLEFSNPAAATGTNLFYSSETPTIALRPELVVNYATNPSPPSRAIDLDVTQITRTPEYYRYDPSTYEYKLFHDEWVGLLRNPGYATTRKWPNNGEVVTFTAHVVNKGISSASGPFAYRWLINGQVVATGTEPVGIAVGQTRTYTLNWTWNANDWAGDADLHRKSADHRDRWVTFEVDTAGQVVEHSKYNNSLTSYLEAPGLGFYVEQSMYDLFNATQNQVGTYSFEDWLNWHVQVWNETYLEMSRFAGFAEDGCLERVRVQRIQVVPDGTLDPGGNHTPGGVTNFLLDGEWGFRPDADYVAKYSKLIEWGLLHECMHQLGNIDLYTMNMEAGTPSSPLKVQVKDGTPHFISRGYYPPFGGLMGGGDTRFSPEYEATGLLAGWDVGALNANTGYRRGFYGEQLYDLPDTIRLRAVHAGGGPIPFARFKIWQSRAGETPDETTYAWQPIYMGTADVDGIVTLPNVDTLEGGPFTTLTGHTLKPNPWGRLNVVGTNGSLLIRIDGYGQKDYTFHRVTEFNRAYWAGHTSVYTHDVPVQISPAANLSPVNIALGRPVTSNAGGTPAHVTDGSLATRWDPGLASAGTFLQVNLGGPHNVALLTLVQNGWAPDFFAKFRIETSLTGAFAGEQTLWAAERVGWGNTVGTRRDIDPADENIVSVTYAGVPTPARFVRITCEEAHWTKLAELRIFADLGGVDSTPPAAVTDLAANSVAATAARLVWTAPGDDGLLGTAAAYDLRFAPFPITAANFASAAPAPNPPSPLPAGTVQTYVLGNLTPDTDYWVALRAGDEVPNWSGLSNVVRFRTAPESACVAFTALTTPVDSGFASGLASDGTYLYFLRRDSGQFFRSRDGQAWTPLPGPAQQLGGWHGDWLTGLLAFVPDAGPAGALVTRHRNDEGSGYNELAVYDLATGLWSWTGTFTAATGGATAVGDTFYAVAHALGSNFGGPICRVDLGAPGALIDQRTSLSSIGGQDPAWFSRAAMLTTLGGRIYGIKNDWTTPGGTGDRVYRFNPAAFNPSVWTGSGPADFWNAAKWSGRWTPAEDLGALPFEVGYGSAVVGLPPYWSCDVGADGGLFIVAGRVPSDQEGWGPASDLCAVFDIATRTFKLASLPAPSGSGASATFHNGAVYIKRGGNPDAPYNTVLWRVTPIVVWRPGDLNCDGLVDFDDIDPFVLALSGQAGYEAVWPACRWLNADCNGDGGVDFDDIDAFVAILSGG